MRFLSFYLLLTQFENAQKYKILKKIPLYMEAIGPQHYLACLVCPGRNDIDISKCYEYSDYIKGL